MMERHYYACYQDYPLDVAIFGSKEARDQWVNHEDEFSNEFPETDPMTRLALTAKEAFEMVGNNLRNKSKYYPDSFLSGVNWVFYGNRKMGGVLV